jgi:hypothetical protein
MASYAIATEEANTEKVLAYFQRGEADMSELERAIVAVNDLVSTDEELETILSGLNPLGGGEQRLLEDQAGALVGALEGSGPQFKRALEDLAGLLADTSTAARDELVAFMAMWAPPAEEAYVDAREEPDLGSLFAPPPRPLMRPPSGSAQKR